jgi:DNA-binding IclR family transcriptional regulator
MHPEQTSAEPGEKGRIQVISRAAAILRALQNRPSGLTLSQIAGSVHLPRSTVQRIVAALEEENFILQMAPNGRARLGPAILRLAASVRVDVISPAHPLMSEVAAKLRETVDLGVIRKDRVVFIDQVVGPERLRLVSAVGDNFPLYCTANGKAFLATLGTEEIVARIGTRFKARTPHTRTTLEALMTDLAQARRLGYATDHEEHMLGVCAIGTVVHDMLGNPVVISVPVPLARFRDREQEIADQVLRMKGVLERQLTEGD